MVSVGSLSRSPPSPSMSFLKIPSSSTVGFPLTPKTPSPPVISDQSSNISSRMCLRACASYNGRTACSNNISDDTEHLKMLLAAPKNFYELLGVGSDASQEEIRSAYRQMALRYHPDVVPLQLLDEATKIFQQINLAYHTLSNPDSKKNYDRQQKQPKFSRSTSSGSSFRFWRSRRNWETDQCWC
eukprot:TRINITY_DN17025_c1_g3_i1.p1 TRINITY_DN17025_c1_g3~~TRINITY_DN17025_c1_g3_i1.p1  ORF type:complete len:185 (-),score=26.82 TRINITY_DN17025_c1_g3_i1:852-1406(-)